MSYHIFSTVQNHCFYKYRSKKWLSIIVELYETGGLSFCFWQQAFLARTIETQWKKWMDRGGGGNIDHVLWACQSDWWGDWRSCHLCFCPQILHHNAHVQGNNQSINKKQNKQKAENDASPPPPQSPHPVATNKNDDNQIDLSMQAVLQTGVGGWGLVALNTIQPYHIS